MTSKAFEMKAISRRPLWGRMFALAGAMAAIVGASGCTAWTTDPEYAAKLATVRDNTSGNEIVGIWVSRFQVTGADYELRMTLLIRSGGTGTLRIRSVANSDPSATPGLYDVKWKYAGSGIWTGEIAGWSGYPTNALTFRYNGHDLLLHIQGHISSENFVFAPSDDDTAVEEHISKRERKRQTQF